MNEMQPNTRPVAPQHAIDVAKLGQWLAASVGPLGGPLEVAQFNARQLGLANVRLLRSDWYSALRGERFDMIVSNPPYIPEDVYPLLPEGIRAFEPREALIAGPEGAVFHRKIIGEGTGRLKPGGWIFLEIGEGQKGLVEALFQEAGLYDSIRFRADYGGIDRVAVARKRNE
jgi:release factor glutamine methyltransferase